ncbi:MAG: polyhydroxyalkanoate synthesis repressor PhaR [Alphaproteobacteria bacterium]|nr:polyhydroxyalkanoate synthesis repressor PhaR [Alphaproteobacteria bacterium]
MRASETPGGKGGSPSDPVTIKKYANRRLYNTATSQYVTLDHLSEMVKAGQEFHVFDAKTGDDITRSVLTQIIFEEEGKGQNLLPIRFLRQLIRFYGDQMQAAVPRYLEMSMESFSRTQDEMRGRMAGAFGNTALPFKMIEEMALQNAALFQETWMDVYRRMLPFGAAGEPGEASSPAPLAGRPEGRPEARAAEGGEGSEIAALKAQMAALEKRLNALSGDGDDGTSGA